MPNVLPCGPVDSRHAEHNDNNEPVQLQEIKDGRPSANQQHHLQTDFFKVFFLYISKAAIAYFTYEDPASCDARDQDDQERCEHDKEIEEPKKRSIPLYKRYELA